MHQIDFHPSDPNMLIWGGEGKIGKSADKRETWKVADLYDTGMYFLRFFLTKRTPVYCMLRAIGRLQNLRIILFRFCIIEVVQGSGNRRCRE